MFNNIVKWEKLYEFLTLYRKSLENGFSEERELLKISKDIAKIGDEEYAQAPPVVKKVIDAVRLYEFDRILNNLHKNSDEFEVFWILRITDKVSQIKNPSNDKQKELIEKAKKYVEKKINGNK